MQQLKQLTLAALAEIDGGRLGEAFQLALKRVAEDCDDRPGVKKPRTITLTVAVLPVLAEGGLCDDAKVQCQITDNIPKRTSKIYDMAMQKGGNLLYRPDSLDNVEQGAFGFEDE